MLELKLFLTSLEMDLEASRAKLPPTYVAHKSFRHDFDIWALVLLSYAFKAHLLVSDERI